MESGLCLNIDTTEPVFPHQIFQQRIWDFWLPIRLLQMKPTLHKMLYLRDWSIWTWPHQMCHTLDTEEVTPEHSSRFFENSTLTSSGVRPPLLFPALQLTEPGTISSSGVTEAIWDYWAYFEPIRVYADQDCISIQQKITHMIDNIFALNSPKETTKLKSVFGLPNVTYDNDFASVVADGIYGWQSLNWDPEVNDNDFNVYCSNITYPHIIYDSTRDLRNEVEHVIKKGGYTSELSSLITPLMNWIGWLDTNIVSGCTGSQDDCFSTHIPDFYAQDDITASWRSWPYQYCTQWGFLQTGSGVPSNILPLISRSLDLEYESIICVEAFNITTPPNTDIINKHGGFNISYPRLAIIDGQHDPWRPATPHASPFNLTAVNRTSTTEEPFIIIDGAVHHWDENGLFANETTATLPPATIKEVQSQEVQFVLAWLEEWANEKKGKRELAWLRERREN